MKLYLFIVLAFAAMAARAQQLPSQVQAKRGVFTERLFLSDRWIDRISTSVPSIYDSSDNVLPTTKAMADFFRLHSLQLAPVTADGDYTHNWNHKQLRIDSINRLRFDVYETDSTLLNYPKVHNTFQLYPGAQPYNAVNLTSALRRVNIDDDSITSRLNLSPGAAMLRTDKYQSYFITGYDGNSVILEAYNSPNSETFQISQVTASPLSLVLSNNNGNIYMQGLRSTSDAATYKPLGFDNTTGKLAWVNTWPGSNARDTTYNPVYTGLSNVNTISANSIISVTRVGNTVTISGQITVTPASASGANTSLAISLPWTSALVGPGTLSGTGFNSDYQVSAQITGDFNGRALFKFASPTTNPVNFSFSFQYYIVTLISIPVDPPQPIP